MKHTIWMEHDEIQMRYDEVWMKDIMKQDIMGTIRNIFLHSTSMGLTLERGYEI